MDEQLHKKDKMPGLPEEPCHSFAGCPISLLVVVIEVKPSVSLMTQVERHPKGENPSQAKPPSAPRVPIELETSKAERRERLPEGSSRVGSGNKVPGRLPGF